MSIKKDAACGTIIYLGVGGIHTEAWAQELKDKVLTWSIRQNVEEAFNELKEHWIGKIWRGELRQGKKLLTDQQLRNFFYSLWNLAREAEKKNISLIEINPIVIDLQGNMVILDGVGVQNEEMAQSAPLPPPTIVAGSLLNPQRWAIVGVSEKEDSFGRKILENLLTSQIPPQNIKIIKPNTSSLLGIECLPEIKSLVKNPVDALILALPAASTVSLTKELCEQGMGANIVYWVAGGIGDGADHQGLGKDLSNYLSQRRALGKWTPAFIGPNSLGVVLSPQKSNTLFISPKRLAVNFAPQGNIAIVSQSGAFLITRLSRYSQLPIKYAFCVGNQLDVKANHFLEVFKSDPQLDVIGLYLEGFSTNGVVELAEKIEELKKINKKVVLYKGGRSQAGMQAAAGHTGSMAGNYQIQKRVLAKSGAIITESFKEFTSALQWISCYPWFEKMAPIGLITNAGFESVSAADQPQQLVQLSERTKMKLAEILKKENLSGLVSPQNPLDLTPMAGPAAYVQSAMVMSECSDILGFCLVPLTEKIRAFDDDSIKQMAQQLAELTKNKKIALGVVVD
ncbi:MAG: CoA-binding protein, partial [Pseudomonadota bacterium]